MSFRATIELNGKTATGIEIPEEVVDALEAGKKPPVRVTFNGHSYRSTVASRGGRYLVGVSADVRKAAGVEAGDEVDVDLELDTGSSSTSGRHLWRRRRVWPRADTLVQTCA